MGRSEDPIVEGTTFGWVIHGGAEYADKKCMFISMYRLQEITPLVTGVKSYIYSSPTARNYAVSYHL